MAKIRILILILAVFGSATLSANDGAAPVEGAPVAGAPTDALVVAVRRGRLRRTLNATRRLAVGTAVAAEIEDPKAGNRFAYAPAIAVGATLAALGW